METPLIRLLFFNVKLFIVRPGKVVQLLFFCNRGILIGISYVHGLM